MSRLINSRSRNKKMIIAIAGAVVLLIIFIIIFSAISRNNTKRQEEIASMASTNVIIEDTGYYGEDGNIEADVTIPYFKNLNDSYNFYINGLIKDRFDYKKVYKEFTAGMKNASILRFKYRTDYERYDYYDFVSIVINEYAELEGNRPRIKKACYVINAKDSRTASLSDAFEDNKDYKSRILEEVLKQAKERNIEFGGSEGLNVISDFQTFYIKDDKMHIFFEASSVAANSYGDLDFEMPFEAKSGKFIF